MYKRQERIQAELTKLLLSPHPGHISMVYETGISPYVSETFHQEMCIRDRYAIFGGAKSGQGLDTSVAATLLAENQNPAGLLMLIPTVIVIGMAVLGNNLFVTLPVGIIIACLLYHSRCV